MTGVQPLQILLFQQNHALLLSNIERPYYLIPERLVLFVKVNLTELSPKTRQETYPNVFIQVLIPYVLEHILWILTLNLWQLV